MNGGKLQNEERHISFLSFLFGGSTKMGIFYREKAFHAGKKIRKIDFAPQKNIPLRPTPLSNVIVKIIHCKISSSNLSSAVQQKEQRPEPRGGGALILFRVRIT